MVRGERQQYQTYFKKGPVMRHTIHHSLPGVTLGMRSDGTTVGAVTIQNREVYEQLTQAGVVYPDLSRSELFSETAFERAYRWASRQLVHHRDIDRRFNPDSGRLFWLWANVRPGHLNDLVANANSDQMLLYMAVPANQTLLTDFDGFHQVLNGAVAYSKEENQLWDAASAVGQLYQTPLEAILEASYGAAWRFDELDRGSRRLVEDTWQQAVVETVDPDKTIQGCSSHLELSWLIDCYQL